MTTPRIRKGRPESRVHFNASCTLDPKTGLGVITTMVSRGSAVVTVSNSVSVVGKNPEELLHQVAQLTAALCTMGHAELYQLIFERTRKEKET